MLPYSLNEVSYTDTHTLVFSGHIDFMSLILTKIMNIKENYKPLLNTLISNFEKVQII